MCNNSYVCVFIYFSLYVRPCACVCAYPSINSHQSVSNTHPTINMSGTSVHYLGHENTCHKHKPSKMYMPATIMSQQPHNTQPEKIVMTTEIAYRPTRKNCKHNSDIETRMTLLVSIETNRNATVKKCTNNSNTKAILTLV